MADLHTNGTANRAPAGVQDDIVERLRWLGSIDCPYGCDEVGNPAADEIERLRTEREAERELADQLASHLEWALKCVGSLPMPHRSTFDGRTAEVVAAYEEARRG